MRKFLCLAVLLLPLFSAQADDLNGELYHDDEWFRTNPRAREIAAHILSYQSPQGGWPKNVDTISAPKKELTENEARATFDNGATVNELRFLGRLYNALKDEQPDAAQTYRAAFDRGLKFILDAQYPNGGWPQFYPVDDKYHRYITFNDGAMPRVMEFLQDLTQLDNYKFLGPQKLAQVQEAVDRGIDCILKCQVRVNGRLTVWCAQHDEKTLKPVKARAVELPSLSGLESTYVVLVLMRVPQPSPQVIDAIESAVAWFEASKIEGIVVKNSGSKSKPGNFRTISKDPSAEPLWARMYDIKTNQPLFSAKDDSIPRLGLANAGYGQKGYLWFGTWPKFVLETHYPAWNARLRRY